MFALAVVIAITAVQLVNKNGEADGTTLGLLVLLLLLLFTVLAPAQTSRVLRRITNLKFAGVELAISEVKRAERAKPPPHEDDGVPVDWSSTGDPADDYRLLHERMTERLRFCWVILNLRQQDWLKQDDYAQIVYDLRNKDLLTGDEENFVFDVLEQDWSDFSEWTSRTRDAVLGAAWTFATRFGPLIWARYVRNELAKLDDLRRWFIADYDQKPGHRPDFLAYRDGRWAVMAARVAGAEGQPEDLHKTQKRLASFTPEPLISGRRIVIPDEREWSYDAGEVKVIRLSALLAKPSCAFDSPPATRRPRSPGAGDTYGA
jgi:hypothetical protein